MGKEPPAPSVEILPGPVTDTPLPSPVRLRAVLQAPVHALTEPEQCPRGSISRSSEHAEAANLAEVPPSLMRPQNPVSQRVGNKRSGGAASPQVSQSCSSPEAGCGLCTRACTHTQTRRHRHTHTLQGSLYSVPPRPGLNHCFPKPVGSRFLESAAAPSLRSLPVAPGSPGRARRSAQPWGRSLGCGSGRLPGGSWKASVCIWRSVGRSAGPSLCPCRGHACPGLCPRGLC